MYRWTACLVVLALAECCQIGLCAKNTMRRRPNRPTAQSEGFRIVELIQSLLNDSIYPEHSRPSKKPFEPTTVKLGVELNAVIDLDEPRQVLKTQISLILNWKDDYLSWDEGFWGVPEIRVPSSRMWLPDITLMNSADSFNFMLEERLVRVKPNGETEWRAFIVISSFCKINFAFFPYDDQSCQLKFRAWTYPIEQVVLVLGREFNAEDAEEHGEWFIENMTRGVSNATEDHGNFSDYVVAISLSRRPQFYVMNIIVPCLIIYCLTLFSFCLPCDSGEKIGLGITILLSLTVFMLISADMMPPTSDNFPLIGQFYTATMVLVAASVGMSVMVLNFNHRPPGARRAPAWMRRLLLQSWCARFVLLRGRQSFDIMQSVDDTEPRSCEVTYTLSPSAKSTKSSCLSEDYSANDHILADQGDNRAIGMVRYPSSPKLGRPATNRVGEKETSLATTNDLPEKQRALDVVLPLGASSEQDGGARESSPLETLLTNISSDLRKLMARKEEEKEEGDIMDEWKLLAKAVDRICLIIFVASSVILAMVLGSEMQKRKNHDV